MHDKRLKCNRSVLKRAGVLMLRAAGQRGSMCSPDGFLPLLWIRGDVKLHLFSRPLDLHLIDLGRIKGVCSLFLWALRSHAW